MTNSLSVLLVGFISGCLPDCLSNWLNVCLTVSLTASESIQLIRRPARVSECFQSGFQFWIFRHIQTHRSHTRKKISYVGNRGKKNIQALGISISRMWLSFFVSHIQKLAEDVAGDLSFRVKYVLVVAAIRANCCSKDSHLWDKHAAYEQTTPGLENGRSLFMQSLND